MNNRYRNRLEALDDDEYFWESLQLDDRSLKYIDQLCVSIDIKRDREYGQLVYILVLSCPNCMIGSYNYTEYEYYKSLENFNAGYKEYKENPEKCHKRYVEFMNNYHTCLMEETL